MHYLLRLSCSVIFLFIVINPNALHSSRRSMHCHADSISIHVFDRFLSLIQALGLILITYILAHHAGEKHEAWLQ